MANSPEDLRRVLSHIEETVGDRESWVTWPGGWPGDIESALVDAVFSARAVYRSKGGKGVHQRVVAWRSSRHRIDFSLRALAAEIDSIGPAGWAGEFGNSQVSPGRRSSASGGASKAATVLEAAGNLIAAGVDTADDLTADTTAQAKRALCSVPGIGMATSNYFLMLLGVPGVKPDRMVHRFLHDATGHSFTDREAEAILTEAARELDAPPHELEHAIWKRESLRASESRNRAHQV